MKKLMVAVCISLVGCLQYAEAELLASESFSTGQTAGDYVNNTAFNDAANETVVVGNTGFGTYDWQFGTSFHKPRNDLSAIGKMTNNSVSASSPLGVAFVTVGTGSLERKSNRRLDAAPSGSSTYYVSGLVMRPSTTSMDIGEEMVIGFGPHITNHDFNTTNGVYMGLYRSDETTYKVTAYAGGNRYELQNANWQQAHHVVLKLDVDMSGNETLNAWVSGPSENVMTQRLTDESVETYSSTNHLESLTIMGRDLGGDGDNSGVFFDEIRLATTLSDVTDLDETPVAGQIASESFSVGNSTLDYTNNVNFSDAPNADVTDGNIGFINNSWQNGTSLVRPRDFDGLTHSALLGTAANGFVFFNAAEAGVDRNVKRGINDVPAADTYYLSALVEFTSTNNFQDGTAMSIGIGDDVVSNDIFPIYKGIHIGMAQDSGTQYLCVFAGSNTYQLAAMTEDVTYQVVATLGLDVSGEETLNAWVAADGDGSSTHVLSNQLVETAASVDDLSSLLLGVKGSGDGSQSGGSIDELRFGVSSSAVTDYTITLPPAEPPQPTEMGEISIEIIGSYAVVSWEGTNVFDYALQGRESLTAGGWSNLVTGITGVDGTMSASNSVDGDAVQFYQVTAE